MKPFHPQQLSQLGLLTAWISLNTLCSYFNRILFHNLGWHFPFFLTMTHGITVSAIYLGFIKFLPSLSARIGIGSFERISMDYFKKYVVPIGFITIISVIFTNLGLDQADVATVNFAKSTGPIFTALLAWAMLGKEEPAMVYPLFLLVMVGVFFALHSELLTGLSWMTLFVVLASSITRSVGNILSEYLIKTGNVKTIHPATLMFYSNPVEVATILPLFLAFELPNWTALDESELSVVSITLLIILDSIAVFALRLVTLHTLRSTSALAITVFAQIKFALAILISTIWFNYVLDPLRLAGAALVIVGTGLYGFIKRSPVS